MTKPPNHVDCCCSVCYEDTAVARPGPGASKATVEANRGSRSMTWREVKAAIETAGVRDSDEIHSINLAFIAALEMHGDERVLKREDIADTEIITQAYIRSEPRIVAIWNNECDTCSTERVGNTCRTCLEWQQRFKAEVFQALDNDYDAYDDIPPERIAKDLKDLSVYTGQFTDHSIDELVVHIVEWQRERSTKKANP